MQNTTSLIVLTLTMVALTVLSIVAYADSRDEQIQRFMSRIPQWGDSTRNDAIQEQYDAEVERARRGRNSSRIRTQEVLDKWGKPDSIYRHGDYESRTYRRGDTTSTIRVEDGVITDFSTYERNR